MGPHLLSLPLSYGPAMKGLLPPPVISILGPDSLVMMPGSLGESTSIGSGKGSLKKVSSGYYLPSGKTSVSNYETMRHLEKNETSALSSV